MSLLGNRRALAFELIPVSPWWSSRYPPEQAAWAGLAIWVGGENLCRHTRPGEAEVGEHLYVPLAPVADWLVRSHAALTFEERAGLFSTSGNPHEALARWGDSRPGGDLDEDGWLDSREGWWSRHFLAAGADGSWLPSLALAREDERLVVSCAPPSSPETRHRSCLVPRAIARSHGRRAPRSCRSSSRRSRGGCVMPASETFTPGSLTTRRSSTPYPLCSGRLSS